MFIFVGILGGVVLIVVIVFFVVCFYFCEKKFKNFDVLGRIYGSVGSVWGGFVRVSVVVVFMNCMGEVFLYV